MFQFLVFSWALILGFVPQQQDCVNSSLVQIDTSKIATVTELDFGVTAWDRIHVYTEVETFQYVNSESLQFFPYRADYVFGVDLHATKIVTFGVVHECDHAIVSQVNLASSDYITAYKYLKNETRVFIKIGNSSTGY
jgi:hypothetical protein